MLPLARIYAAVLLSASGVFTAALAFVAAAPGGTNAATAAGWSLVAAPSNGTGNAPSGVTCSSPSDCWAVGNYIQSQSGFPVPQTFVEHWDGASWAITPSPNANSTQRNTLGGVACTSASDCWAVGSYTYYDNSFPFPQPHSQTLIEHWNGAAWSIVASPNTSPTQNNSLSGVACTSGSDCWAVGDTIQHWNGTSWTIFTLPASGFLSAVTCVSGNDCWAVGGALIEHWNGASWSVVAEPGPEANPDSLGAVTCTSGSDCWAVGTRVSGVEENQTLIEHWNGSAWAIVPSPNPDPRNSAFSGVACASASQCWAGGSYYDGTAERTSIAQWNGSAWATVTSPSPSARQNRLRGVTCASSSLCWAVGDQLSSGGADLTLFEIYTPTVPPLTRVVSRMNHGSSGAFDIELPLAGSSGVECRSGGANGNYTLVFNFANNLTSVGSATVTTGIGSVASRVVGPNANQYTVQLTGVIPPNASNGQLLSVTLGNVLDAQSNAGSVAVSMGVLVGDVNGDRAVNSGDAQQTRTRSGQPASPTNFRSDVNADGTVNSGDAFIVRQHSGEQVAP